MTEYDNADISLKAEKSSLKKVIVKIRGSHRFENVFNVTVIASNSAILRFILQNADTLY